MKKKLDCLTPEAISNRFEVVNDYIMAQMLKTPPWFQVWAEQERAEHIIKLMEQKGISHAKAEKIVRDEEKRQEKERNSPLAVANRRIAELEARIETIKEFINDPDYMDKHGGY